METLETVALYLVFAVVAAVPILAAIVATALGVRWNERNALVWLRR